MCQPGAEGSESKKPIPQRIYCLKCALFRCTTAEVMGVLPEESTTSPLVPRLRQTFAVISKSCLISESNRDLPWKIACRSPRSDVWVRYIIKEGERRKKLWAGKGEVTGDSYLVTRQKWGHKPEQPKGKKEKSTWWRTGQVPNGQAQKTADWVLAEKHRERSVVYFWWTLWSFLDLIWFLSVILCQKR